MQNMSNKGTGSQGAATCESNNLQTRKQSDGKQNDTQNGEHPLLLAVVGDNNNQNSMAKAARSKADIDLLAQNRGNAMLRYKEKKKTRRFVTVCLVKSDEINHKTMKV